MGWKIFYADGSTFSSEEGGPGDAPAGPQAVAERRDGRRILHIGGEYYFWNDGTWRARPVVRDGMVGVVLKTGSLMNPVDFEALKERAMVWLHKPR